MKKLFILLLLLSSALFANIGTVMAVKGEALVQRSGADVDAKAGMGLLEGDSIITQKQSRVQVMLKDNTVVTVGAKSNFSFEEFSLDGKNSKVSMKAKRGFFRSVTGQIAKLAPDKFKIKTKTVTIGIRGTDFSGDIGVDREILKCYDGAIFIEFDGKVIEVDAGAYVVYGPKGIKEGKIGSGDEGDSDEDEGEDKDEKEEDDEANEEEGSSTNPNIMDPIIVEIPIETLADLPPEVIVPEVIVAEPEPFTIDIVGEDRPVDY